MLPRPVAQPLFVAFFPPRFSEFLQASNAENENGSGSCQSPLCFSLFPCWLPGNQALSLPTDSIPTPKIYRSTRSHQKKINPRLGASILHESPTSLVSHEANEGTRNGREAPSGCATAVAQAIRLPPCLVLLCLAASSLE